MAERRNARLDQPRENVRRLSMPAWLTNEAFGVLSEKFARFMGTAQFLIGMTVFVVGWIVWNAVAPPRGSSTSTPSSSSRSCSASRPRMPRR
jgi:Protein of unknown function (DUF1003).